MNSFPCSGCGQCCRLVGKMVANAKAKRAAGDDSPVVKVFAEFPYQTTEEGVCSMLGADNSCMVYGHRPVTCNIDQFWNQFMRNQYTDKRTYYQINATACNQIMEEGRVSSDKRIDSSLI